MKQITVPLEIHIHLEDGTTTRFSQEEEAIARQILRGAQPARLFASEAFLLSDKSSMVAIQTSRVVRVDFVTELSPEWPVPADSIEVHEVCFEEFIAACQPQPEADWVADWHLPDLRQRAYMRIELTSGDQVFLRAQGALGRQLPLDQSMLLRHVFSGRGLCAHRRGGGYSVFNPASITRLGFFPGAAVELPGVWQAACQAV